MGNDEDFERIFKTPAYIDLVAEISAKSILYGLGKSWKSVQTEVKGVIKVEEYKKDDIPSASLAAEFKLAVEKGITDGTYPNRPATRAEVAVMVYRATKE